ncbi:MAG: 2OG-Fe(II) oxygenase [Chromatiales bacterium]|nr:2OG-Fe(II) oxygenase [Chromatiales bacterium]
MTQLDGLPALPDHATVGERVPDFRCRDQGGLEWQFYERILGKPVLIWIPRAEPQGAAPPRLRDLLALLPESQLLVLREAPVPDNGSFAALLGMPSTVLQAPRELIDRLAAPGAPALLLTDRNLRIVADCAVVSPEQARDLLQPFPSLPVNLGAAPLLVVPSVLLLEECRWLLRFYLRHGGTPSGMPSYVSSRQMLSINPDAKARHDLRITDPALGEALAARLSRRLLPEIERAFCWRARGYESFKLVCYGEQGPGYFRPHRDNLAAQATHRRFAVTLNLNSGEYSGGSLRFPEFGPADVTAPAGAAIVFSCALAHELADVTAGCRYALLTFLH